MSTLFATDNPFLDRLRRHARMPVLLRAAQYAQPQSSPEEPAATSTSTAVVRATLAPAPDPADDAAPDGVSEAVDLPASPLQPGHRPNASPAEERAADTASSTEEDASWRRLQAIARGHRERQANEGGAPSPPPTPSTRATHVLRRKPEKRQRPAPETAPRRTPEGHLQRDDGENDELHPAPVAEPPQVPAGGGGGADDSAPPESEVGSPGDATSPGDAAPQGDAGSQSDAGSEIAGRSEIGGNLSVGGSLTSAGDVNVGGSAEVGNNMTSQQATIGGGATAGSSVQVGNDAEIAGGANVGGVASVGGDAEIAGPVQVGSAAVVQGNADVGDTATVGGAAIVQGDLSAGNSAEVGAVARVSGDVDVGGPATVGGAVDVEGNANVGQALTANTASVSGDATVSGEANVGGSATVGGNLNVGGNATISGPANVAGNMNAGDGITVVESGSSAGEGEGAQRRPDENVPLESAWPVQRKEEEQATTAEAPGRDRGDEREATPDQILSAADAHALDAVRRALEDVESGPTHSSVELVLPRRPRPSPAAGSAVQRKAESQPPSPDEETTKGDAPQAAARDQAAVVETEIGPLPGDLWQLLGREKPQQEEPGSTPPSAQQPTSPVRRTAEDPRPQASPSVNDGPPAVQRAPAAQAPAAQAPAAQAATEDVTAVEEEPVAEGDGPEPDIEALARQVFNIVRRQLQIDWERGRGRI